MLWCLKCRQVTQRGEGSTEDPIDHYHRCWADDPGVAQLVICSTCQSEIARFMRNEQTENKRRGSKRKHENDEV